MNFGLPEGYIDKCELRFADLARDAGYCKKCPLRPGFLAFMGEEDPVNVPENYVREAKACAAETGCQQDG